MVFSSGCCSRCPLGVSRYHTALPWEEGSAMWMPRACLDSISSPCHGEGVMGEGVTQRTSWREFQGLRNPCNQPRGEGAGLWAQHGLCGHFCVPFSALTCSFFISEVGEVGVPNSFFAGGQVNRKRLSASLEITLVYPASLSLLLTGAPLPQNKPSFCPL